MLKSKKKKKKGLYAKIKINKLSSQLILETVKC